VGSAERSDFVIALVELHVVSRIKVASLATARPHAYQYACSAEKSMRDLLVAARLYDRAATDAESRRVARRGVPGTPTTLL
jgi:hypothetical protein